MAGWQLGCCDLEPQSQPNLSAMLPHQWAQLLKYYKDIVQDDIWQGGEIVTGMFFPLQQLHYKSRTPLSPGSQCPQEPFGRVRNQ